MAHQADRGGDIAGFLNGGLDASAERIGLRIIVAPQTAVLHVDGLRQIGGQRDEAAVGDVVHPLDDFRNAAARAGNLAGFAEQRDADLLLGARDAIRDRDLLRLDGKIGDAQAIVQERIVLHVDVQLEIVLHRVADRDQPIGQPIAQAVALQHRHRDVDIGLELDQALARIGDRALPDADELHAILLLECLGESDEVLRVHLQRVGMAGVANDLIVMAGNFSVRRIGPIALDGLADDDHRTAVVGIPVLHGLERGHNLVVVVAVVEREDVPAVGGPLIDQAVVIVLGSDDAAEQRVVDAGVVIGEHHAQALANLQCQCLCLQLLGVTFGHGELAFERDDFGSGHGRADHVPECGFAGGGRDADAGGSAVDVVGEVGAFGVTGQRADAASLGFGEERMIGQAVFLQDCRQCARAAAKAERIDAEHGDVRIDVIALVAGGFVLARQSLAHDHPERVAGGDAVAARQHELVAVGMLGTAIVVAQSAEVGTGQMHGDVVGRVGQRSAEMAGLSVVAEQDQRHAGHEADVFQTLAVVGQVQRFNG